MFYSCKRVYVEGCLTCAHMIMSAMIPWIMKLQRKACVGARTRCCVGTWTDGKETNKCRFVCFVSDALVVCWVLGVSSGGTAKQAKLCKNWCSFRKGSENIGWTLNEMIEEKKRMRNKFQTKCTEHQKNGILKPVLDSKLIDPFRKPFTSDFN